jgi:N-acetylmuramoyl-L-alanine amidase
LRGTVLLKSLMVARNVEPRLGSKMPSILLLHYTGMDDAEKACNWLCAEESKVSCHYLVDESGRIVQMVDEDLRAWHAGVSSWHGETDVNSVSIGIEIQNSGHSGGYPDFPEAQIKSVVALSQDIVARHCIAPQRVLAHSDVAPARKIDPGEKFPWRLLHENGVGHWVAPARIEDGPVLKIGDQGDEIGTLQSMLQNYGYGLEASGSFDKPTQHVVSAFQRHFRPERVDGIADVSTIATLKDLLSI